MTEHASGPTTLDLWNLRAKLGKVYEDAKEDPADVNSVKFLRPILREGFTTKIWSNGHGGNQLRTNTFYGVVF